MSVKRSRRGFNKQALRHRVGGCVATAVVMLAAQGCPTQTVFRRSAPPPPPVTSSQQRPLPPYNPPPAPQARTPVESDPIREEDLKERRAAPQPRSQQEQSARALPPPAAAPPRVPAPLQEQISLLGKITSTTPPQRAASIRLTEEGRLLLESGDSSRALSRLEKAIAVDSTSPYGFFFLASAHAALGRQQESLKFLDVAEPLFGADAYWLSEVFTLRGENYRALGSLDRAGVNYSQALRLNPGNRLAAEGLGRTQEEGQPGLR
jgi:hypothetical protein